MSTPRVGRPESYGTLAGNDMVIKWTVWAVDSTGHHPVDLVVDFKDGNGHCWQTTAEFAMDPIAFVRKVKDEPDWKKWLLQMAQMAIISAAVEHKKLKELS